MNVLIDRIMPPRRMTPAAIQQLIDEGIAAARKQVSIRMLDMLEFEWFPITISVLLRNSWTVSLLPSKELKEQLD